LIVVTEKYVLASSVHPLLYADVEVMLEELRMMDDSFL